MQRIGVKVPCCSLFSSLRGTMVTGDPHARFPTCPLPRREPVQSANPKEEDENDGGNKDETKESFFARHCHAWNRSDAQACCEPCACRFAPQSSCRPSSTHEKAAFHALLHHIHPSQETEEIKKYLFSRWKWGTRVHENYSSCT